MEDRELARRALALACQSLRGEPIAASSKQGECAMGSEASRLVEMSKMMNEGKSSEAVLGYDPRRRRICTMDPAKDPDGTLEVTPKELEWF